MQIKDFNFLSQQLLFSVKTGKDTNAYELQLAQASANDLKKALKNDELKKAFWINCYNAYFLILTKIKGIQKPAIYRQKLITIAGIDFSLDEIEHGILRKYRWKWSLGYLPNLFASSKIKQLAVQKIDYRIHFALNCGAKSCPPIRFYQPEQLEQQLNLASASFLEQETQDKPEENKLYTTQLFQWYIGDFGGVRGIRQVLTLHLGIPTEGKKILFNPYNREEQLDNFVDH